MGQLPNDISVVKAFTCPPRDPERQNGDFGQNSAYFPLIFHLKWYPIFAIYIYIYISAVLVQNLGRKLKHGTPSVIFLPTCLKILPNFCLCSAHFLPIFRLTFHSFFTGPVLQGKNIQIYMSSFMILCMSIFCPLNKKI